MCNQGCVEGMSSSKCVEYNADKTVEQELNDIELRLLEINKLFDKTIDGKTLGTGQNLLATVQKLVDKTITPSNTNVVSQSISVDLQCLSDNSCTDSITTQDQFNALIVKNICSLLTRVNALQNQY